MTMNSIRKKTAMLACIPTRLDAAIRNVSAACFKKAGGLDAKRTATFALAAAVLASLSDPAFAQGGGGGDITSFLQNIVNIITGTAGKLIAVIAICIVGIGALMGGLSMRAAGGVILGVLLIFSASWIVDQIIGG